jgi:hypothetical protein
MYVWNEPSKVASVCIGGGVVVCRLMVPRDGVDISSLFLLEIVLRSSPASYILSSG